MSKDRIPAGLAPTSRTKRDYGKVHLGKIWEKLSVMDLGRLRREH